MANRNTANSPRPGGPGGPGRGPGGGGGGGRHAAIRGGEKPKDLKGTIKKSFAYLGIYKAGLAIVMVLAALSSVFRVIGPRLLGNATDVLYKAVENGMLTGEIVIDYNALLKVVMALCALYVVSYIFNIVQSFTTAQISNNITYRMRKQDKIAENTTTVIISRSKSFLRKPTTDSAVPKRAITMQTISKFRSCCLFNGL